MESFISSKEKSKRIMRIKSKTPVVMGKGCYRGVATAECIRIEKLKQPAGTSHRHLTIGFLYVQVQKYAYVSGAKTKRHDSGATRYIVLTDIHTAL